MFFLWGVLELALAEAENTVQEEPAELLCDRSGTDVSPQGRRESAGESAEFESR